jgi:hypothetical protein
VRLPSASPFVPPVRILRDLTNLFSVLSLASAWVNALTGHVTSQPTVVLSLMGPGCHRT